jgi:hypothetical protein
VSGIQFRRYELKPGAHDDFLAWYEQIVPIRVRCGFHLLFALDLEEIEEFVSAWAYTGDLNQIEHLYYTWGGSPGNGRNAMPAISLARHGGLPSPRIPASPGRPRSPQLESNSVANYAWDTAELPRGLCFPRSAGWQHCATERSSTGRRRRSEHGIAGGGIRLVEDADVGPRRDDRIDPLEDLIGQHHIDAGVKVFHLLHRGGTERLSGNQTGGRSRWKPNLQKALLPSHRNVCLFDRDGSRSDSAGALRPMRN